jgi:hypothetical protein
LVAFFLCAGLAWGAASDSDQLPHADQGVQVMDAFVNQPQAPEELRIQEKSRHQILFAMGVVLLISLLLTAGMGISMVLLGKELFVAHMVCAGISVFLALAHSVTAVVWFYPF